MKVSFKLKIALLSLAVSGTLLIAFGVLFFAFTFNAGIDRMDQELRTLAESSLRGSRSPEYWEHFENSLQFIYGEDTPERIALYVVDAARNLSFESENAPSTLVTLLPAVTTFPKGVDRDGGTGGVPLFVKGLDADQDGRISVKEFDGPMYDFRQLDRDQDGFISQQEAVEMDELPRRPQMMEEPPVLIVPQFHTLETVTGHWRVGVFQAPDMVVLMALDMDVFYQDIKGFQIAFFTAVLIGLVLLALAGWLLADRAMRPVAIIANTAEGITAQGLNQRIPMVGEDSELERLVRVFNSMLDRLEKGYRQAVRFSADAAHELQTPLTILQGELDNAIQTSDLGSEEQQRYSNLMEELSQLKAVVQKLLLLAHADEGRLKLNAQPVDLSELLHSSVEDLEVMAPQLEVDVQVANGVQVLADAGLLNQVLRNMTSNAAKYTAAGGQVRFLLESDTREVRFTLANTATEIPVDDQPLLFERFHRVEKSRTTAGSGLGLSLAREIARAHGGGLVLNDYQDGQVSFTLTLPI
jgi:signal transduction histidine kinase